MRSRHNVYYGSYVSWVSRVRSSWIQTPAWVVRWAGGGWIVRRPAWNDNGLTPYRILFKGVSLCSTSSSGGGNMRIR